MKRKLILFAMLGSIALFNTGCPQWDSTAYKAIASARATLDCASAEENHNDAQILSYCSGVTNPSTVYLPRTPEVHDTIAKAIRSKDAAVQAMITYEAAKGAASASDQATMQQNVNTAVQSMTQAVATVTALITEAHNGK